MKVTIYHGDFNNRKIAKIWKCDDFEEKIENGFDVLYIIRNGIKEKVCNLGNFNGDIWGYSVDRSINKANYKVNCKEYYFVHR